MSILGTTFMATGFRMALFFYNDNTFEFKKLPVKDASVVITKGENIESAWPALNKLMLPFAGLKGIKRTKVLPICENDIIYDIFDKLEPDEKPNQGDGLVKEWIQKKAETIRYRHQAKPKVSSLVNRVVMFLGIALVAMVLMLIIIVAKRVV